MPRSVSSYVTVTGTVGVTVRATRLANSASAQSPHA
jgi:hypothetical protein